MSFHFTLYFSPGFPVWLLLWSLPFTLILLKHNQWLQVWDSFFPELKQSSCACFPPHVSVLGQLHTRATKSTPKQTNNWGVNDVISRYSLCRHQFGHLCKNGNMSQPKQCFCFFSSPTGSSGCNQTLDRFQVKQTNSERHNMKQQCY